MIRKWRRLKAHEIVRKGDRILFPEGVTGRPVLPWHFNHSVHSTAYFGVMRVIPTKAPSVP